MTLSEICETDSLQLAAMSKKQLEDFSPEQVEHVAKRQGPIQVKISLPEPPYA